MQIVAQQGVMGVGSNYLLREWKAISGSASGHSPAVATAMIGISVLDDGFLQIDGDERRIYKVGILFV